MRLPIRRAALSATFLVAACATSAAAQDHQHPAPTVGSVRFPVACNAAAQQRMHVAVAMLHSFWFPEARKAFSDVARADPRCGMAHWGIALTHFANPLAGGSGPESQALGAAAAAEAARIGSRNPRDSGYIASVGTLFRDHGTLTVRQRLVAYEEALARLVAANPANDEARIFHAIIMVANAPPSDKTYARQQAAAAVLTDLYRQQPDHPGLAHYIIHAFDAPSLAQHALVAARQYASIAPAAPHALHMPSHTFTRLGYWDESIATNRRSADAEPVLGAKAHPLDYLVYAYLQQGRIADARAVVAELAGTNERDYHAGTLGSYNGRAMTARLALELDDWDGARRLGLANDPPSVAAVTQFTRALGAARSGDAAMARAENARLDSLVSALRAARDEYWTHVAGAQRMAVDAWIAHREGRVAEARDLARQAADAEDAVEKHPITPGPLIPARELYADLLLAQGEPGAALAEYQAVMQKEPNRLRTLHGALRAAGAAGDDAAARRHAAAILALVNAASPHSARAEALRYQH